MNVEALIQETQQLIQEHSDLSTTLYYKRKGIIQKQNQLDLIKLDAKKQITAALDDKGKPLYSNEEKRKIAIEELLNNDKEYQDSSYEVECIQDEIALIQIKLSFLSHSISLNTATISYYGNHS